MSRWFRFYAEAMRNPKVLRLSDKDFRLWVQLLAVASENAGKIPPLADLRLVVGMRLDHLNGGLNRLISGGLIDPLSDPLDDGYEPHGWAKFQYKSDVSTSRVHKHRAKRNVSQAVSETPPEADTEQSVPFSSEKETPKARKRAGGVPDWVPPDPWAGFVAMRIKIKKPLTDRAIAMAVNTLAELREGGEDIAAVLDQSTLHCWQDLYPVKAKRAELSAGGVGI